MKKGKGNKFSDVIKTSLLLIGVVIASAGIYQLTDYIRPDGNGSSSEPLPPDIQPIIPEMDINVLVDGVVTDGHIQFDELNESKTIEIRMKSDNQFYSKKTTYQAQKKSSFEIVDLNGDGLFVRTRIKILKKEYTPVKMYVMSDDFMFYMLLSIRPNPATSIDIGDITFLN